MRIAYIYIYIYSCHAPNQMIKNYKNLTGISKKPISYVCYKTALYLSRLPSQTIKLIKYANAALVSFSAT